jgi:hypothetical protein
MQAIACTGVVSFLSGCCCSSAIMHRMYLADHQTAFKSGSDVMPWLPCAVAQYLLCVLESGCGADYVVHAPDI